jgi:hypothetical protein
MRTNVFKYIFSAVSHANRLASIARAPRFPGFRGEFRFMPDCAVFIRAGTRRFSNTPKRGTLIEVTFPELMLGSGSYRLQSWDWARGSV